VIIIDAGVGSLERRRSALSALLAHPDARVRSAGVAVLGALAKAGEDSDRTYAQQQLVAALGAQQLMVVASATSAAAAVCRRGARADRPRAARARGPGARSRGRRGAAHADR
jgi:hypothetical protein